MPRIKSFSPKLNLDSYETFITDVEENSIYFRITDFNDTLTGGKNGFLIEGTPFLKESTDLQIEILDVNGDPIFHEPGKGIPEYYEGISKLVSMHVYEDTPIGDGKITIFGELETYIDENGEERDIPQEWQGTYNVKWTRRFKINNRLSNEDLVRFVRRPRVTITELSGSLFSREFVTTTQSGSVRGIPSQPEGGTNLDTFPGSTFYKLRTTDGSLFNRKMLRGGKITVSGSVLQNIEISDINSDTDLIIREPYTINGIVESFSERPYTLQYESVSSEVESTVLASFARFKIDRLKTFVGDVARLKVYSKPAESINEFEIVDDIRLEASEILTTPVSGSNVPYGIFTSNYAGFWNVPVTSDYVVSQSNDKVFGALQITGGDSTNQPQRISTKQELELSENTEYTFEFDVQYTGTITQKERIHVYLEYVNENSITLQEDIIKFQPTEILKNQRTITKNVITPIDGDYTLVIDVYGKTWDIGNVSLVSSQESSFSPDDIQFTIPIQRNLEVETYDFKFEFFDINNNYIPVDIFASNTFRLGNVNSIDKFIRVNTSPRPYFQFDENDLPNPENQNILITLAKNRIQGSLEVTRTIFDIYGEEITEAEYQASGGVDYPGELEPISSSISQDTYNLPISNFTGSLHSNPITPSSVVVGNIEYEVNEVGSTAPQSTSFTIYRQDVGDSSKQVQVGADKNQFTYKRTDLRPTPAGQEIVIELTKSNIPGDNQTTITKVGNGPTLTGSISPSETETYVLTAGSQSLANEFDYGDGTTRYTFQVNDVRGVPFSGSVKIDPVIIDDSVTVNLTQDSHTFNAQSNGKLVDAIESGNVNVRVQVGGDSIQYDPSLSNNTWAITTYSGSGADPYLVGGNVDYTGDTATVGITGSYETDQTDEAVLTLDISYKDGTGRTEVINKTINYSKSRVAAPILTPFISPKTQTVSAYSTGAPIPGETYDNVSVQIQEIYRGQSTFLNITSGSAIDNSGDIQNIQVSPLPANETFVELGGETLSNTVSSTSIGVEFFVTDSEGEQRSVTDSLALSKAKNAKPSVVISTTPQSQLVSADSSGDQTEPLENVVVQVLEGGIDVTTGLTINNQNGFDAIPTITQPNTVILSDRTLESNSGHFYVTASYQDSEGTTGSLTTEIFAAKAIRGGSGPGVVFRGIWSGSIQYIFDDNGGRRDAVLWSGSSGEVDTYYATLQNSTNIEPSGSPTYWEELGQEDFFVAAKISIFEESFVENTINVGTNPAGNESNITIWGGNDYPYISIGQNQKGYRLPGIFAGTHSGSLGVRPVLSLVSGSSGELEATFDLLSANPTARFNNIPITSTSNSGSVSIKQGILTAENAIIDGIITADEGRIGGFNLDDGVLVSSGSFITIDGNDNEMRFRDLDGTIRFIANNSTELPDPFRTDDPTILPFVSADISGSVSSSFSPRLFNEFTQSSLGFFTAESTSKYTISFDFPGHGGSNTFKIDAAGVNTESNVSVRLQLYESGSGLIKSSNFHNTSVFGQERSTFIISPGGDGEITNGETSYEAYNNSATLGSKFMEITEDLVSGSVYELRLSMNTYGSIDPIRSDYECVISGHAELNSLGFNALEASASPSYTIINGGGFQSVISADHWIRTSGEQPNSVATGMDTVGTGEPGDPGETAGTHVAGGFRADRYYVRKNDHFQYRLPGYPLMRSYVRFQPDTTRDSSLGIGTIDFIQEGVYQLNFTEPFGTNDIYGVIASTSSTSSSGNGNGTCVVGVIEANVAYVKVAIYPNGSNTLAQSQDWRFCTVMVIGG